MISGQIALQWGKRTIYNFRTIKNIIRHYIVISVPYVIILKETSGKT